MEHRSYPGLQEEIFWDRLSNGLTIAVIPRKGFSRKMAYFVTGAGSMHRTFTMDGKEVTAREGETVAAALIANGIRTFRHTAKHHEPRGIFCGIGQCTDCIMEIDGVMNVRACMTMAKPGMVVRSQDGHGKIAGEGKDAE